VIITRTPLRISLGGGGTDIPSYYTHRQCGFLVAAAITRYIYVAAHENFDDAIFLKYSKIERVSTVNEVTHPLLREALRAYGIEGAIEISSMADIPAGTGLGSSGAFTVGVLRALSAYQHRYVPSGEIAAQACHIEIDVLGEPVGKQDQYIASIGGLTAFRFNADGSVESISVPMDQESRRELEENLVLFFTGIRRSASSELAALGEGTRMGDEDLMKNLDDVKAAGELTFELLSVGRLHDFARQLTAQWRLKYDRAPTDVHERVNSWIETGIDAGAIGGKLIGAGGGGFLLFYAEHKTGLRKVMTELGFREVSMGFDYHGSQVVVA
jgi:D-glycero-alpha-D-manno-heptose-7-phosphate kinase